MVTWPWSPDRASRRAQGTQCSAHTPSGGWPALHEDKPGRTDKDCMWLEIAHKNCRLHLKINFRLRLEKEKKAMREMWKHVSLWCISLQEQWFKIHKKFIFYSFLYPLQLCIHRCHFCEWLCLCLYVFSVASVVSTSITEKNHPAFRKWSLRV